MLKNFLFNKSSRFNFINYDIRWLPIWAITKLKKKGIPVIGWTVRSEKEYKKARKWYDNIVFEGFDPEWSLECKNNLLFEEKPVDMFNSTFNFQENPYPVDHVLK